MTATAGTFSGGEPPVETSNDIQVSDDGTTGWKDKTGALTYLLKESDVGKFFRSNSIAIDAVKQELWYESEAIGPVVAARTPITVTSAAHWSNLNDYTEGGTVFAECANFAGGTEGEVIYRYRWQTRASGNDSWVNGSWKSYTDHALEVESPPLGTGQIRFQCQARDASVDPAEQVNSFTGVENITPLPTLVVGEPVITGEPIVGYTLFCSEPTVEGGSGNPQFVYSWIDANSKAGEASYQGNSAKVIDYDLGKVMYCIVSVSDPVTGETKQVESNHVGPINRPVIPEFTAKVDGEVWDDPDEVLGMVGNESVVLEVSPELTGNLPLDLKYEWKLRSEGEGRFTGDVTAPTIVYTAPGAQGTTTITCTASSRDANDTAFVAQVLVMYREPDAD